MSLIIQENIPEDYCQKFMAECQRYFDSGQARADRLTEIKRINNLPGSKCIRLYGMNTIEVTEYQKSEYDKMVKSEISKIRPCSLIDELRIKAECAEITLLFIPKDK